MGVNKYYDQFKDDSDLFPSIEYDDFDNDDDCEIEQDEENEYSEYPCCGGRGCMDCLGLSW